MAKKTWRDRLTGVGVLAATLGLAGSFGRQDMAPAASPAPQTLVSTNTGLEPMRTPVMEAPLQAPEAGRGGKSNGPASQRYVHPRTDLWQEKSKLLKNGRAILLSDESLIFAMEVLPGGKKIILSGHNQRGREDLRDRLEMSLKENDMRDMWCVGYGPDLALVATERHTPGRVMELLERAEVISHEDNNFADRFLARELSRAPVKHSRA